MVHKTSTQTNKCFQREKRKIINLDIPLFAFQIGLLSEVNLHSHPGLVHLLLEGETIDDLLKLSPEEILIRWVNYHLRNAGCNRQIANFSSDIKVGWIYFQMPF